MVQSHFKTVWVSYKIRDAITYHTFFWVFTQISKNIYLHEDLYTNFNRNFIHNNENLETTSMSIDKGMAKQIVLCPHKNILFIQKVIDSDMSNYTDESQYQTEKRKKPDTK